MSGLGWRGGASEEAWRWPSGAHYEHIGPCRCGFGPHAFWMERSTDHIFRGFPRRARPVRPTVEDLRSELKGRKAGKEALQRRIS